MHRARRVRRDPANAGRPVTHSADGCLAQHRPRIARRHRVHRSGIPLLQVTAMVRDNARRAAALRGRLTVRPAAPSGAELGDLRRPSWPTAWTGVRWYGEASDWAGAGEAGRLSPVGDRYGQLCDRAVPCRRGMPVHRPAHRPGRPQSHPRCRAPSSQDWQPQ